MTKLLLRKKIEIWEQLFSLASPSKTKNKIIKNNSFQVHYAGALFVLNFSSNKHNKIVHTL